jgi:hypothetical protein
MSEKRKGKNAPEQAEQPAPPPADGPMVLREPAAGALDYYRNTIASRVVPPSHRRARLGAVVPSLGQDGVIRLAHYYQARRGFASDSALADACGVHRSRVARWKLGDEPEAANARLLRDLATVVSRLADYYDRDVIPDWLYGSNPDLGGESPIDTLRRGGLVQVLAAAEAQTSGSYF